MIEQTNESETLDFISGMQQICDVLAGTIKALKQFQVAASSLKTDAFGMACFRAIIRARCGFYAYLLPRIRWARLAHWIAWNLPVRWLLRLPHHWLGFSQNPT